MSSNRRKKRADTAPTVRRGQSGRKRLSPELEGLARGEETRLRVPRRRAPRLRDPRASGLVPGVANRDARRVFDHRVNLILARKSENQDLADALAEAWAMRLWRGRSIASFEAFVADVLELSPDDALQSVKRTCSSLEIPADGLSDEAIAIWFRSESALLDADLEGRVRVAVAAGETGETIRLEVAVERAPGALHHIGRRLTPLMRDQEPPRDASPPRDSRPARSAEKKKRS